MRGVRDRIEKLDAPEGDENDDNGTVYELSGKN